MKKFIIAGVILVGSIIGIAAATANYPTNVYDLPLSRMSRALISNEGTSTFVPSLNTTTDSFNFPVIPFAFAITEISSRSPFYQTRQLYVEIDGVVNRVIFTNAPSEMTNTFPYIGGADCANFVIKSPIFIPPGSTCRLLMGSGWSQQPAMPSLFVGGYALQPGEY